MEDSQIVAHKLALLPIVILLELIKQCQRMIPILREYLSFPTLLHDLEFLQLELRMQIQNEAIGW